MIVCVGGCPVLCRSETNIYACNPRGLEICTIIGFTVLYYQFRTVLLIVTKENEAFMTKEYLFE